MEGLEAILGGHSPFLSFQSLPNAAKAARISRKSAFWVERRPFLHHYAVNWQDNNNKK